MRSDNSKEFLKGNITIYIGYKDKVEIRVEDENSRTAFLTVEMTSSDFCSALGKLAHVPCKFITRDLDLVGKRHEHDELVFEIPEHISTDLYKKGEREKNIKALTEYGNSFLSDGWKIYDMFQSQGSFFTKDNKSWARCTIKRWV